MEGTFTVECMVSNGAVVRCTNCGDTYSVLFGTIPHCPAGCNDDTDMSPVDSPDPRDEWDGGGTSECEAAW